MGIQQRLHTKLVQKLILTPSLQQAIKLLPMSTLELTDHLIWQLSMQTDESTLRDIGAAIIGNLDDDGYLVASFDELAAMGPWPVGDVERALKTIQGFDPVGVAARDLQECLLLQLRH